MKLLSIALWIFPVFIMVISYFSSQIQRWRFERFCIYTAVLFGAFILDLQSFSFRIDYIDFIFLQITVLIGTDFFWRGIRQKNKLFRISTLIIGIVLFYAIFHDWITSGPKKLQEFYSTTILSHSSGKLKGYYVKKRGILKTPKDGSNCMELYKKKCCSILEKRLSTHCIPYGYEKASFTFNWHLYEKRIAVDLIGNTDTIWTLTDPGPPK